MRQVLLLFAGMIVFGKVDAQVNLVPNPSFEQYDTCTSDGKIHHAIPWIQPTHGTSDYFNSCSSSIFSTPTNIFGFQNAHSGNAYGGFFASYYHYDSLSANYREYLEVKLLNSLAVGETYYVSFYVALADSSNFATDNLGIYFSTDSVFGNTYYSLPHLPQIQNANGNFITSKATWTKISSSFVATGGEVFMTIGNFNNYQNTDTVLVAGGADFLSNSNWAGGYYYIDDVCVSTDSIYCETWTAPVDSQYTSCVNIYPNPTDDLFFIECMDSTGMYFLYDSQGQLVDQASFNNSRVQVNSSALSDGIYLITIRKGQAIETKKIIIKH